VNGFLHGLDTANYAVACDYVEPDLRAQCRGQLSRLENDGSTLTAHAELISGNEALVGVTGKMCDVIGCTIYHVPPLSELEGTFARLYKLQTTDGYDSYTGIYNSPIAPTPCTEIGGQWYVGPYSPKSFVDLWHEMAPLD